MLERFSNATFSNTKTSYVTKLHSVVSHTPANCEIIGTRCMWNRDERNEEGRRKGKTKGMEEKNADHGTIAVHLPGNVREISLHYKTERGSVMGRAVGLNSASSEPNRVGSLHGLAPFYFFPRLPLFPFFLFLFFFFVFFILPFFSARRHLSRSVARKIVGHASLCSWHADCASSLFSEPMNKNVSIARDQWHDVKCSSVSFYLSAFSLSLSLSPPVLILIGG